MNRTAATGSTLGSLLMLSVIVRAFFPSAVISTTPAVPSQVASAPSSSTSDKQLTKDGPWKASQNYFAFACGPTPGKPGLLARRLATWCIPEDTHVLALMAVAPDPVRTHMALTFDRTLESVQLAGQQSGYVIDRYWLPWSVNTTASSGAVTTGQSASPNNAQSDLEVRSAEPGLVLLRRDASPNSPDPSLLFVFLVADLPTGGIDGRQFKLAVQYIDEVCDPGPATGSAKGPARAPSGNTPAGCVAGDPVRIIGPTFSGSLASLGRLVELINHRDPRIFPPREFRVYSGSVSGLCAMHDQGFKEANSLWCEDSPQFKPVPNIELFRTFVHDTESAIGLFVQGLVASGAISCNSADVAILSEAATTFGRVALKVGKTEQEQNSCSPTLQTFAFPREISNLRNASSPPSTATTTTVSADGTTTVKPFLTLDLTDRTNSSDAPPDFSLTQGPLSKEAVLMNYAAELRRGRYRYIGVLASNVLDSLFVAGFLRAACPDARLFMISSDLLFERELDNVPYVGMLSVSTYPLVSRNLKWTSPSSGTSQLPFADEFEVGGYNAMLQAMTDLLQRDLEFSQVRQPFSRPTNSQAPQTVPLWMTVVGSDGYWPVRLLDRGEESRTVEPSLEGSDVSGSWQVILLMVCGLAALHVGVLLTASPFAVRFRDFAPVGAVPRQRQFYIQTASAALMLGLGLMLMPVWRYPTQGDWFAMLGTAPMILKILGTAAMIAVGLAALLLEGLYCLRWRWTRVRGVATGDTTTRALIAQVLTFAGVWVLTGLLLYVWWTLLGPEPDLYGFFFGYRVVHPVNGVSPLPPIIPLLVTIYAWSCFEIWRLRFNDGMRPRLIPDLWLERSAKPSLPGELTEHRIADAVNRYLLRLPYLVPFATVYLIWIAFLHPLSPFELFEQWRFGLLYEVLFCLVVALMLSAAFRMAQIWIDLRRLLIELERRPVRAAFSRVKGMTWSFWRQGGETAEWDHMARSLEALGQLGSGGRPRESGVPPAIYFRRKVHSAQRIVRGLKARTANADAKVLESRLQGLKTDMAAVAAVLASGEANPFFQTAVGEVQRAIEACLVAPTTEKRESLRSELEALSGKLDQCVATLRMLTASTIAQHRVGEIRKTWLGLQHDRPLFPALDSLKEYARVAEPPASQPEPRIAVHDRIETRFRDLQKALAVVLSRAWAVLEHKYQHETSRLVDHEDRLTDQSKRGGAASVDDLQLKSLEEFVALRYLAFIRGVLGHLRHVMIFLALSFSLVLISLNIYSFEPHQSLIWSFTLIFVITGCMVVGVLVQLHRDPILSRVTGTTGNALDLHFYLRIVAFGAVPLLTLLATHFPSIGRYLVSFLRPSLEALK